MLVERKERSSSTSSIQSTDVCLYGSRKSLNSPFESSSPRKINRVQEKRFVYGDAVEQILNDPENDGVELEWDLHNDGVERLRDVGGR